MVDLFTGIPDELIESTLQTIRENLDKVGLFGGHTLRKHTDIQLMEEPTDERGYPLCYFILGCKCCGGSCKWSDA